MSRENPTGKRQKVENKEISATGVCSINALGEKLVAKRNEILYIQVLKYSIFILKGFFKL